jgi:hypothetical protein
MEVTENGAGTSTAMKLILAELKLQVPVKYMYLVGKLPSLCKRIYIFIYVRLWMCMFIVCMARN